MLLAALAIAPCAALAAPQAHEHGALKVDVTIDGNLLTVGVETPLDSLLGFERAPRNDKERRAADDVLARLRGGVGLFSADAAAQCTLSKVEVNAPVLETGTKPAGKDEHTDLDASFEYKCAQPQQLRTLDIGLFEGFKRIQRIEVRIAGPTGQTKTTLKRPERTVKLVR